MKLAVYLLVGALAMTAASSYAADSDDHECALNFKMNTIDGKEVDLEQYEGKVVLIVNVASKCGLTRQYEGLQELYTTYKDKDFVILAFPCNQFGGQEPGTEEEIKEFCTSKYSVTFPMFAKIDVNGDTATPLYKYLTSKDAKPAGQGKITWNFEKFLIDRDGQLVGRFSPRTAPADATLIKAIEAEL